MKEREREKFHNSTSLVLDFFISASHESTAKNKESTGKHHKLLLWLARE
jgi:hypothetical protein